jgi:hypothetical protein
MRVEENARAGKEARRWIYRSLYELGEIARIEVEIQKLLFKACAELHRPGCSLCEPRNWPLEMPPPWRVPPPEPWEFRIRIRTPRQFFSVHL